MSENFEGKNLDQDVELLNHLLSKHDAILTMRQDELVELAASLRLLDSKILTKQMQGNPEDLGDYQAVNEGIAKLYEQLGRRWSVDTL